MTIALFTKLISILISANIQTSQNEWLNNKISRTMSYESMSWWKHRTSDGGCSSTNATHSRKSRQMPRWASIFNIFQTQSSENKLVTISRHVGVKPSENAPRSFTAHLLAVPIIFHGEIDPKACPYSDGKYIKYREQNRIWDAPRKSDVCLWAERFSGLGVPW